MSEEKQLEKEQLEKDLAKYTEDLKNLQEKINEIEAQKQEMFRVGVRIEGVVAYLKQKIADLEKEGSINS